ncbi:caspase-12-like [Fukomys damarensis]|uniref:caspase-12-like n=1 Tax=Fukomys damarensis TaxID=885580 RepID=UPI0008FF3890|nr:caspase-12-like [Fukomys damarensis]
MVFVNRKGRKPLSAFAFTVFPAQRVWTAMAAKEPLDEDPLNNIKSVVTNLVEGIFHDFGKNVLNKEELRKIKKDVNLIVNNTENLVEDIIEKTEKASKLFANHFKSSKKQLRLKFHPENDDESEKSSTPSSPSTASEDENEESRDEENTLSAETLAISPVVPQETHSARSEDALKLCPPDHFDKLKTEKADEIYPVMKKEGRTRLALIICNKTFDSLSNRNGADIDLLRMQDLLNDLGYSVIVKVNLTAQGMETELRRFADHEGHQSSDSTFLVFMSHGILDGICGTKHSINKPDILHDDTIFTIFNNHNCKNLRNKPKIIIMQACRGRGDGIVWVTTERGEAMADTHSLPMQYYGYYGRSDAVTMTHIEKDFIAFKSSTPHNVSWILDTGSLFISQLIYFIKEYCWSHHLEEIFRMVQRSFETPTKLTQMPTIERVSMTRYFYLFPGN